MSQLWDCLCSPLAEGMLITSLAACSGPAGLVVGCGKGLSRGKRVQPLLQQKLVESFKILCSEMGLLSRSALFTCKIIPAVLFGVKKAALHTSKRNSKVFLLAVLVPLKVFLDTAIKKQMKSV